MAIDLLKNQRLKMLHLQSKRSRGHFDDQSAILTFANRKTNPHRYRMVSNRAADNRRPVGHQRRLGKAVTAKGWTRNPGTRHRSRNQTIGRTGASRRPGGRISRGGHDRARIPQFGGMLYPAAMPILDAAASPAAVTSALLAWYDRERRHLPWRAAPGDSADPYRVWLSEVMLQQTTVAAVIPYFTRFLESWPTVAALANAPTEAVMQAWAGLGYYARARNLHLCAKTVWEQQNGRFPDTEERLRLLPGIGDYTAAAIAAIAFGRPAVVVDGNVERVMARLFAVTEPLPDSKPRLKACAAGLTPTHRPGDYAQAVMDLGATLCSPRSPACGLCPWRGACAGQRAGIAADLPARRPKPLRPTRYGLAFWIVNDQGSVLLRRRPPRGLLGGMIEVPSTDWRAEPWDLTEALAAAPLSATEPAGQWRLLSGQVRHTFTHFHLELAVATSRFRGQPPDAGLWCPPDRLSEQALPSVMHKVATLALSQVS